MMLAAIQSNITAEAVGLESGSVRKDQPQRVGAPTHDKTKPEPFPRGAGVFAQCH